ncbi:MAG: hypothetical protein K0S78_683 [Thermomicrobiales bacterium]|jgi:hypothetical protein|nr:hypothetical protein [Thermomicrobiales bacterium]
MVDAFAAPAWSRRVPRDRVFRFVPAAIALLLALSLVVPAGAQVIVSPGPSVTVTGTGEATAPAESATVQLLIGQGGRRFGFSEDASGSSGFESAGFDPVEVVAPAATPVADADDMANDEAAESAEGRRGRKDRDRRADHPERTGPQPITAERLAPVVAAVVASTGIAPEAVAVDLSPLATEPFDGRQRSARVDFDIPQPTPEALAAAIAAASDIAAGNGMVVEVAGVLYNPADCAPVEQEATEAAIADAREQADRLAELLGVTIGGVVSASSDPYFGRIGPEEIGCAGQQSSFYDSAYGGLGITVPVFDPSAPAEVEVYAVLTVGYEIVEG